MAFVQVQLDRHIWSQPKHSLRLFAVIFGGEEEAVAEVLQVRRMRLPMLERHDSDDLMTTICGS